MLTNVFFVIALARTLDPILFGRLAIVYGLVQIVVGTVRSTTVEIAAANHGGEPAEIHAMSRHIVRSGLFRLSLGVLLLALVSYGLFSQLHVAGLLMAAVLLPVGMLEIRRQLAFAALEPGRAVRLDAVWFAVSVTVYLAAQTTSISPATEIVLAWGLGAAVSLIVNHERTKPGQVIDDTRESWRSMSRADGFSYAAEFLLSRGTPEVVGWALAITGGIAQAGSFRLAQTILGPLSVVIGGLRGTLIGELRRVALNSDRVLPTAARVSFILAILPLGYLAFVVLLPDQVGQEIVGPKWTAAIAIAPYLAMRRSFSAASIPPFLVLRIKGKSKVTSSLRLAEACLALGVISVGGLIAGETGALVGFAAAGAASLSLWWIAAGRGGSTHQPAESIEVEQAGAR